MRHKYDYLAAIPTSVVINLDDLLTEKYRILCNVPVDSGFFNDTVKDLIRRNSPEKRFELACRNDMIDRMRELGADDERILASEPILRAAFRDYLSEVFLSNLGAKLKNLKEVRNSIINIVDTASEARSSCIPKSLRKDLQNICRALTERPISTTCYNRIHCVGQWVSIRY